MSTIISMLRCDIFRFRRSQNVLDIIIGIFWLRTFRPIFTLRLLQWLHDEPWYGSTLVEIPTKILHRWFCASAAMDFPYGVAIGSGLCITHGWGLVVSPGAIIGANCTLFHGVTIGRKDKISANGERKIGYPVIGDECWVGPGACVLGGIHIGRGSIIGAGAVVIKDVPPHAVVVGNPARVVRLGAIPDVFNRPPLVVKGIEPAI